jgi:two-component system, OmpR family, sensor histidine kinase CpxA
MRIRFPLYAKILLWFFLNLAALGIAFYVFFQTQVKLGLNSLMMGRAGDRIQAVSEIIAGELNKSPGRAEADGILKRFSESYHVRFYLFQNNGRQVAGEPVELPRPVANVLAEQRGPPSGAGRGRAPFTKFMERVNNPIRYWVGVRVAVTDGDGGHLLPATLLAVSDSMSGGGLFLDFKPWIEIGLAALIFSVLFWIPLVRGITRSISQMTHATAQMADGHFDAQVRARRSDELGRLGESINRMASRLSGFVTGQKRFLGDIAHELCSPIARIQVALGILEQQADERQKACVEDLREEVQQMSDLVNELLSFSKASLKQKEIALEPVALADLARRVVEREAAGARIAIEANETHCALASPDLLERALGNVVRNAVRYAGHAGPITITSEATPSDVVLAVCDAGPGLPAEALDKIFDPFYRPESSRSRDTGGTGLGLTIVKTCVEACQGTVTVRNRQPSGLRVEMRLRPCPTAPA